ncbi:hypothetical protein M378DRAFT_739642 [Amanita muscaria Koide BX008]|uniref:Uncharacterized protein n=1 Tax=Amanita muscaria (strain Koide BX008) TaxID=946122 RepID=A0A0C2T8G7_AMAMK|nr:hypothetical protein M378DRAFT_739642 [Amanita muscaria Koide BX008]
MTLPLTRMPRKKGTAKEENRSVPGALMGNSMLMNLILPLFRRQDHSFSSNTIYTNTSMSHLRASRDNQVIFLVFRFRQRQGHGVASSLSGGKRLLLFPVQLCGSKPAGLSHSCSILSEPIFHHQRSILWPTAVAVYHHGRSRMWILTIHSSHPRLHHPSRLEMRRP